MNALWRTRSWWAWTVLALTSCLAQPLTTAEIDEQIKAQSKPYPTPLLLADCLGDKCADNANNCQGTCFEGASDTAKPIGEALWNCWKPRCQEDACKTSTDPQCMSQCLVQKCGTELIAAIDTEKTGEQACFDTVGCLELCDPTKKGLFTCMQECWSRSSKRAKKALSELATCAAKGDDPKATCHVEMVACFSGTVASSGDCHTFSPCFETCSGSQTQRSKCYQGCRDKLNEAGKTKFDDMTPCFDEKNAPPKCHDLLRQCIEPSGKHSCIDVFECMSGCKAAVSSIDKTGCLYSCLHNTDAATYDNVFAIGACDGDVDAKACGSGLLGCADPQGSLPCKDIQPCVASCSGGDDGAAFICAIDCLNKATTGAANKYVQMFQCLLPCEKDCKTTACKKACNGKCNKEIQACAKG